VDKVLHQFAEVAAFGNVSRAAEKLGLSQPALTHSIKKLEESLGIQLFIRTPNGMALTECGQLLFEQTRIMQRIFDTTLEKMNTIKARREQNLKFGIGDAWWYLFGREALKAIRHQYTAASIHVEFGNHLRLMDQLLSGDLAFFIGHEIGSLSHRAGVIFKPLFHALDAVFVRNHHPLLSHECSMDDLFNYPTLVVDPDNGRYYNVLEDLTQKTSERLRLHLTEKVVMSSNSILGCIDLLNDSDCVMPYPEMMTGFFSQYDIQKLTMHRPYNQGPVGIYMLKQAQADVHLNSVVTVIQQQARLATTSVGDRYPRPGTNG